MSCSHARPRFARLSELIQPIVLSATLLATLSATLSAVPVYGQYTAMLTSEINPTGSANPHTFTEYAGQLYFVANGTTELWRYDPSAMLSEKVLDGARFLFPAVYNDRLFWGTGGPGSRIHVYDASTDESTTILPYVFEYALPVVYDDKLFFQANSGSGTELHYYDAVADTAVMVADLDTRPFPNGNANPRWITEYDGRLFFNAIVADASGADIEPVVYDSDTGVAEILVNLNPGGISNPESFTVLDDKLYFVANDGAGAALWAYDSSTNQASAVTTPGEDPRVTQGGSGIEMLAYSGRLYFATRNELWVYDPATGDAAMVTEITQPMNLTVFDTRLFMQGRVDGAPSGIWYYDSATAEVDSVSFPAGFKYSGGELFAFDGRLYFSGTPASAEDRELWSIGSVIVSTESTPTVPRMELAVYPNPSDQQATIKLTSSAVADAEISVYNVLGRRVATIYRGRLGMGTHDIPLITDTLPSGLYLIRARSGAEIVTSRLVIM